MKSKKEKYAVHYFSSYLIANGIQTPREYNKVISNNFDCLGDETIFMQLKNVGLVDSKAWKLFVRAGKEYLYQIQDEGLCSKLYNKDISFYTWDANPFLSKYKVQLMKARKKETSRRAQVAFNDFMLSQLRILGDTFAFIVNTNNDIAYKNGLINDKPIPITAENAY